MFPPFERASQQVQFYSPSQLADRFLSAMNAEGDYMAGPESSRILRVVASVPP
jgi:hypothetical protein